MEDERKITESLQAEDTQKKMELTKPISEEEFKEQIHEAAISNHKKVLDDLADGILHLRDYNGVRKFKSVRRAIRRGHISIYGDVYPKRPFNNRKRGKGSVTYQKKRIYEQLTHKTRKTA